jgi:hypothetical protein
MRGVLALVRERPHRQSPETDGLRAATRFTDATIGRAESAICPFADDLAVRWVSHFG